MSVHKVTFAVTARGYAVTSLPCVSGTSIVFDMSLTYILVALLAVILNNVLVERLSMHTRITVGKSERRQEHRSSGKLKTVPLKLTLLLIKYFGTTQSRRDLPTGELHWELQSWKRKHIPFQFFHRSGCKKIILTFRLFKYNLRYIFTPCHFILQTLRQNER